MFLFASGSNPTAAVSIAVSLFKIGTSPAMDWSIVPFLSCMKALIGWMFQFCSIFQATIAVNIRAKDPRHSSPYCVCCTRVHVNKQTKKRRR